VLGVRPTKALAVPEEDEGLVDGPATDGGVPLPGEVGGSGFPTPDPAEAKALESPLDPVAGGLSAEITIDWAGVDEDARQWASDYAYTLVRDIQATSARVLQSHLAEYFNTTLSYRGLLDALAPTFGRKRAEVVAQTEVTRAAARGEIAAIKRSNGVISRYRFFTTNDERACPACSPLHLKVFNVGEGPLPPRHPRCRCYIGSTLKPLTQ
jgi:SPP1 gp7 family putative phage head morphogenesis protein